MKGKTSTANMEIDALDIQPFITALLSYALRAFSEISIKSAAAQTLDFSLGSPSRKPAHGGKGLGADVVLDTFGIHVGDFGRHAHGQQELDHFLMPPPALRGQRL